MRLLLPPRQSVGAVIGGIQVGVPTLATAHHKPAAAGVLIAMLSIGGIVGAAAYGSRRWAADAVARLTLVTVALAVCTAAMVTTEGLVVLGLLLLLAGSALNPMLTTLSLLVDRLTSEPTAPRRSGGCRPGLRPGRVPAAAIAGALVQHGAAPARRSPSRPSRAASAALLALALPSDRCSVAIASAAAPSSRPTKPIPSPRVAFTLTCSGAIPIASASTSRI